VEKNKGYGGISEAIFLNRCVTLEENWEGEEKRSPKKLVLPELPKLRPFPIPVEGVEKNPGSRRLTVTPCGFESKVKWLSP